MTLYSYYMKITSDYKSMTFFSKTITLRVPSDIIYRALKDSRLEKLFPEYFLGVKRNLAVDKENKELTFETRTR